MEEGTIVRLSVDSVVQSNETPSVEAILPHEENLIEPPKAGNMYNSPDELFEVYSSYGNQQGFEVIKRSRKNDDEGKLRAVVYCCSKEGKSRSRDDAVHHKIQTKTGCQARVRATISLEGKALITSILLEHNHPLSPSKVRYFKKNRTISASVARRLELYDQAGIGLSKSYQACAVEKGGIDNLTFLEQDARNHVGKARRLRLGAGDAQAVYDYFTRMSKANNGFRYAVDVDEKSRLKNVVWVDARSRAAYKSFGDVITFDTTYLTNKYDMPFAPFVGVNHHGQSILFGCGLISSEDTETFSWLFSQWLSMMDDKSPDGIITDQDRAMQNAIRTVFPNARHRWCLWHILKKIPEKLSGCSEYESLKTEMLNIVYESYSRDEYEYRWVAMIEKYRLQDNGWLTSLFAERRSWAPVFVKDKFWAGMSTTQRSESMNAFFDGYVHSKTTLKQFVEQYDNALKRKVENEAREDFKSFNGFRPCITNYPIELQFRSVYTNAKFKEVQDELKGKLYCRPFLTKEEGDVSFWDVSEDVAGGHITKKWSVVFSESESDVKCNCFLFEFKGILCRHSLHVLSSRGVLEVPSKYILSRWRKDLKREHTDIKVNYDGSNKTPKMLRFDEIMSLANDIVELGSETEERKQHVMKVLEELKTAISSDTSTANMGVSNDDAVLQNSAPHPDEYNVETEQTNSGVMIHSPNVTRRKGRPPRNRKISTTDKIVKRMRSRARQQVNSESGTGQTSRRSKSKHVTAVATGLNLNEAPVHDSLDRDVCELHIVVD